MKSHRMIAGRILRVLCWIVPSVLPAAPLAGSAAVQWKHPAGLVTKETLAEIRDKLDRHDWARKVYAKRKVVLDRWLALPSTKLRTVFPKKRGNVYHNFSCPVDRCRLEFDPFGPDRFECPCCGRTYAPETDAGIYPTGNRYHGTMYDGWTCLFFLKAAQNAGDMGVIGHIEGNDRAFRRGIEILMLHADTIEKLKVRPDPDPQMRVLLTYHREGDNKVLNDLAFAYEMLRDHMTAEQRTRFETTVLKRMLDDIMLEPIYRYDHNNLYQWYRTIIQVALTLHRDDLIDWSMGYGAYDPQHQPEHRSICRLAASHFKPDGAFWGMCSGYHLYPLHFFCELAAVSHNVSRMDPKRFPPLRYDLTDRDNPAAKTIDNALHWFLSMAMPDRSMPTVGDSMAPRAGMDDYAATAEVGYRFFDVRAIGGYERLRRGERSWTALLYGAPEIRQYPTPYTSSYLSSGWVSLRNDWQGNRVWVGLNALIPGSGHQHADRLTLLMYSHGRLLALEKATPYNESVTRELGSLSCSHSTVTVDKTSQKQGESLVGTEVPRVAHFFTCPSVKYAELHGDRIYPQTQRYRRSVALIEDVVVDCFDVRGGNTHDWMIHHAGSAPSLSVPVEENVSFEPAPWLAGGSGRAWRADGSNTWESRWLVDGVTSRLKMAGAAGTEVYRLETYPINNATVTKEHPPCRTLCVRRTNDAPFLAVWDAWKQSPNLRDVHWGDASSSVDLETSSGRYRICFGPGHARFEDGVTLDSDAAFSCVGNDRAVTFVAGSRLEYRTPRGELRITTDKPASVAAEYADAAVTLEIAGDLIYDTVGGQDHYRAAPAVDVAISGDLWRVERRRRRLAGKIR